MSWIWKDTPPEDDDLYLQPPDEDARICRSCGGLIPEGELSVEVDGHDYCPEHVPVPCAHCDALIAYGDGGRLGSAFVCERCYAHHPAVVGGLAAALAADEARDQ